MEGQNKALIKYRAFFSGVCLKSRHLCTYEHLQKNSLAFCTNLKKHAYKYMYRCMDYADLGNTVCFSIRQVFLDDITQMNMIG